MIIQQPFTFAPLADAIIDYYSELRQAVRPLYSMDEDMRPIYSNEADLYYNQSEEDAEMKAFLFRHEIFLPLKKLANRMHQNINFDVATLELPNEYRMSPAEVGSVLKSTFARCRNLILESVSCKSSDYEPLKKGILGADEDALSTITMDMTDYYKRISLADKVYHELIGRGVKPLYSDMVITALYRPASEVIMSDFGDFAAMKESAMSIVVDIWNNTDRFSTLEMEIVERTIKSDIFGPFREECAVHYQKTNDSRPPKPGKLIAQVNQTTISDSADVISGIQNLANHLGIGSDKAQKIVDSKILQRAGVSYKIGRTNFFNKKKLHEFLAANPESLQNI